MTALSIGQARRLAIRAQRLCGPRPAADLDGLLDIGRSIRCFQLDPISVAGAPSQELVAFSRLGPKARGLLDKLAFKEKRLFHYYAHAASMVLTEDFPIFRPWMRPYGPRTDLWGMRVAEWLERNSAFRDRVLGELDRRGPLRLRDIEDSAEKAWTGDGWNEGRNVGRLLEILHFEGHVTVVGRDGQHRIWGLADRWYPEWMPREVLPLEETVRRALGLSLRGLGIATPAHLKYNFTRGRYPGFAGALSALVKSGEAVPIAGVGGLKGPWYAHRDALPWLEEEWRPRTVLLSPFDNLVADRDRALALFGFDYKIEIYVPPGKRRYGYYSLPILRGDRLVGRLDPFFDRKTRLLNIKSLHMEPGRRLASADRRAIAELARFAGAVEVAGLPGS